MKASIVVHPSQLGISWDEHPPQRFHEVTGQGRVPAEPPLSELTISSPDGEFRLIVRQELTRLQKAFGYAAETSRLDELREELKAQVLEIGQTPEQLSHHIFNEGKAYGRYLVLTELLERLGQLAEV